MALEPIALGIVEQLAPTLKNRRVLCLGYPDLLVPQGELTHLPEPRDAQEIAKWHHWRGRVVNADAWLKSLDLTPEYWDIVKARGPEWVVDLNVVRVASGIDDETWIDLGSKDKDGWSNMAMLPSAKFGLLIDPGTSEHIFNVGNAFRVLSQICATEGYVLHLNPLGMGNHGMWSIHPTAYTDFYEANGFSIEMMAELSGPLDKRNIRAVPSAKRFNMAQDGLMLVLAKKEREVPFTWPTQTKYRKNPMLKGEV